MPLDAAAYLRRFLDHWRPGLLILTESEIWPNLVLETAARHIPIAMVNGRLSRRSHRNWRKRRTSGVSLFSRLDLVLAQNQRMADWFTDLGSRHVIVAGNLKMDVPAPPVDAVARAQLASAIGDRRVLLAASTHADEEAQVARVHAGLKADLPGLLTIIAPRHPERGPALAAQLAAMGLRIHRRAGGELPQADTDIYLADTIGELGTLYTLAPLCLMGGSLVPHGGQNPIEAIKHDCGVITGTHTANFADTYEALNEERAVRQVASADELQATVRELLLDADKLAKMRRQARAVVERMSGVLARSLAALRPMLPPPVAPAIEPPVDAGDPAPAPQPGLQHAD